MQPKRVLLLGSTGSIGQSTLDVVDNLAPKLRVVAIAAGKQWRKLLGQIERYAPIVLMSVFFADQFLHLRIFSRVLGYPIFYLAHLFAGDSLFRLMRVL